MRLKRIMSNRIIVISFIVIAGVQLIFWKSNAEQKNGMINTVDKKTSNTRLGAESYDQYLLNLFPVGTNFSTLNNYMKKNGVTPSEIDIDQYKKDFVVELTGRTLSYEMATEKIKTDKVLSQKMNEINSKLKKVIEYYFYGKDFSVETKLWVKVLLDKDSQIIDIKSYKISTAS